MTSKAIETQKTKLCINAISETVSVSFTASSHKISRAAGDWTAAPNAIVAGMVVSTDAAGNLGPFLVASVTTSDIVIDTTASLAQGFANAIVDGTAASHVIKAGLPVKEMTTFSGLDGTASTIDTTSMDSTSKEFLMGLRNNGGFKGDFNFVGDDPGQVAMLAAIGTRALTGFHLRMSNNSIFEFSAYVLGRSLSGGVDAKADTNFTLQISGDVTYDAAFVTGA